MVDSPELQARPLGSQSWPTVEVADCSKGFVRGDTLKYLSAGMPCQSNFFLGGGNLGGAGPSLVYLPFPFCLITAKTGQHKTKIHGPRFSTDQWAGPRLVQGPSKVFEQSSPQVRERRRRARQCSLEKRRLAKKRSLTKMHRCPFWLFVYQVVESSTRAIYFPSNDTYAKMAQKVQSRPFYLLFPILVHG